VAEQHRLDVVKTKPAGRSVEEVEVVVVEGEAVHLRAAQG
jgi:hypothetical protein